jgi:hypothetical protein
VADISTLIDRVRLELGDLGKSFAERIIADGTTNRFQVQYNPLNADSIMVYINGVVVPDEDTHAEEGTGTIVLGTMVGGVITEPLIPDAGDEVLVNGTHYRYFTTDELTAIVTTAVTEHTAKRVDSMGRTLTISTLSSLDEYPVAIYATTMALYTLATDASFDIDIMAPDGVSIPRSERYRQLMDMIAARQNQYKDLCVQLGVGLYSIDVFTFRRISKTTNRYVPVYKPQEVDDRSIPQRAEISLPTYGDANIPWITEYGQLLAYQDRAFTDTVTFTGDYAGYGFTARLVLQRGSIQRIQPFTLSVTSNTPHATVTGIARSSGGATTVLTTSAPHGFAVGNTVRVERFTDDTTVLTPGRYVISAVTSTTFTVADSALTTAVNVTGVTYLVERGGSWTYTAALSLTRDQTLRLPSKCWWQVVSVNPDTDEQIEVIGGDFITRKIHSAIL